MVFGKCVIPDGPSIYCTVILDVIRILYDFGMCVIPDGPSMFSNENSSS